MVVRDGSSANHDIFGLLNASRVKLHVFRGGSGGETPPQRRERSSRRVQQ